MPNRGAIEKISSSAARARSRGRIFSSWLLEGTCLGGRQLAQIATQDELILRRRDWKVSGQGVVFVSGSFDLLNPGHIRLLEQARSHGDILIVGIQSDASVRAQPVQELGPASDELPTRFTDGKITRPIIPAAERAEILASLAAADYVVEFDEASPTVLLERLSPDVIVKPSSEDPKEKAFSTGVVQPPSSKVVHVIPEPGYPI